MYELSRHLEYYNKVDTGFFSQVRMSYQHRHSGYHKHSALHSAHKGYKKSNYDFEFFRPKIIF